MPATVRTTYFGAVENATSGSLGGIASTAGDLVVVFLPLKVNEVHLATISDTQGLTWTQRISDTGAGPHNIRVWTAPANGATTQVSVGGWTTAADAVIAVAVVKDTSQAVGATGFAYNSGNSTSITIAITTEAADSLLLSLHAGNNVADVSPAGFTLLGTQLTAGTSTERVGVSFAAAAATGGANNHQWGDGGSFRADRNVAAIEIRAASGGPDIREGTATVTAAATVTASGAKRALGMAAVSAATTAEAAGQKSAQGEAAASASTAVSSTGRKVAQGSASIEATATVTARGGTLDIRSGTATVSAASEVEASGRKAAAGSAGVSAASSVGTSGRKVALGSVVLLSAAEVYASGRKVGAGTAGVVATVTVRAVGFGPDGPPRAGYLTITSVGVRPALSGSPGTRPALSGTINRLP